MRNPARPLLLLAVAVLVLTLALVPAGSAEARKASRLGVHEHVSLGGHARCPKSRAHAELMKVARQARRQGMHRRYRQARRRARRLGARASKACSSTRPRAAAPGSIYWGAWISKQLTGEEAPWDMDAVSKFEGMTGKGLSIVNWGSPFSNCSGGQCSFYDFPTDPMESVREHGSIPFLSWSSQSIPTQREESDYQLSDVAGGAYDSYIREFATDAAKWGHPFFLRFNWEMNGNWFPWGVGANGNTAADYVAAWRHVHDVFSSVGATNATWVWCPNVDPGKDFAPLDSLYPGDSYVDWTCLDGYNWGTAPNSPNQWAGVDNLFRSTYDEIVERIAPSKPMIIGETAASEYGGSKADWISELLTKIPTEYPQVRGLLWFEKFDDGMDWPLETSASATSAFATGIQAPAYATNSYANLSTSGPIPPPVG